MSYIITIAIVVILWASISHKSKNDKEMKTNNHKDKRKSKEDYRGSMDDYMYP